MRAAITGAMVEHLEASWLSGGDYDVLAYTALTKLQVRLLITLGLERRARNLDMKATVVTIKRIIVDPKAPDGETLAPPPCPVGLPR
ncbi:hypothetical protein [Bradyrhizobium daqingense]|uniref:hypothetical protein n=1 Tax=Bradyrhizobium daqingense TaxID=993502 RepID=UPI0038387BBF